MPPKGTKKGTKRSKNVQQCTTCTTNYNNQICDFLTFITPYILKFNFNIH